MEAAASAVLSFWLGGDAQTLYKTKWFASNAAQTSVDKDIEERFGGLFDEVVSAAPVLCATFELWRCYGGGDAKTHLALIIVLDQFSRHIYRRRGLSVDAPERAAADAMALSLAEELVEGSAGRSSSSNGDVSMEWAAALSTAEAIFALMPYRHSKDLARYEHLGLLIERMERGAEQQQALLLKFKKHTTRRLLHLQDRARAEDSDDILEFHEFAVPDCAAALKDALVVAAENFLRRHSHGGCVAISLSGGVDSMVIAKILCLLRDNKQPRLVDRIVALHIDYANRAESEAEAAFVENWCSRHGIVFYKRVVAEVTRGVTDRSEYERISRDIRYSFYQEVLATEGAPAVVFGHHLGDVQENVISNVMHGVSPLQLSGMAEVGVTNGVEVWRPLLRHYKKAIYDFSHAHGVPYFKDTTPSWSTRGKLRSKLVPLLIDMYGDGCLSNLSTLAQNSDDSRDLVGRNIYAPFLGSVSRRRCGVAVNALPYKSQPIMFWREMLKELMHSMGMCMVREKSAANFMERLERFKYPVADAAANAQLAGWLEMRKNFNCHLDCGGNLIVFHEDVLATSHGSRTKNDLKSLWPTGIRFQVPGDCAGGDGGAAIVDTIIGCWEVKVYRASSSSSSPTLSVTNESANDYSVLSFLDGWFSYSIPVHADWCVGELAVLADCKELCLTVGRPATSAPFRRIDARLRAGIPLLVPLAASDSDSEKGCKEGAPGVSVFTFVYSCTINCTKTD